MSPNPHITHSNCKYTERVYTIINWGEGASNNTFICSHLLYTYESQQSCLLFQSRLSSHSCGSNKNTLIIGWQIMLSTMQAMMGRSTCRKLKSTAVETSWHGCCKVPVGTSRILFVPEVQHTLKGLTKGDPLEHAQCFVFQLSSCKKWSF